MTHGTAILEGIKQECYSFFKFETKQDIILHWQVQINILGGGGH